MKPWPAPALSIEQEVLYLSEPNSLGFFRNTAADEESLLFIAAFSEFSTCTQEGVGESQQLPCPDFQAGNLIYVRGDLVIWYFRVRQTWWDMVGGLSHWPLLQSACEKIMIRMCLYFYPSRPPV